MSTTVINTDQLWCLEASNSKMWWLSMTWRRRELGFNRCIVPLLQLISKEYLSMIERDELLEYALVYGNWWKFVVFMGNTMKIRDMEVIRMDFPTCKWQWVVPVGKFSGQI
uniref:Uncharacterized protein n=1 Tax=Davidia involucrata TaxID=16924 RepID=A0A5B7C4C6_DAVIN